MTRLHPRRFAWLVAAATVVPIGVLTVLGARVLQQDRAAEAERAREALEVTGLRVALDIDRALGDIEAGLARGEGIVFTAAGLTAPADMPLLYQPSAPIAPFAPPAPFVGAEIAEHQHEDFAGAAAAYTRLTESPDARQRAAALLALGRVHRKRGDRERALRAYADLEALGSVLVPVVDQPAALVARQARGRLFEEAGDPAGRQEEATGLAEALAQGGWPIDRVTFDVYRDLIERWGGQAPSPDAMARTNAAVRLWRMWRAGELPSNGRRMLPGDPQAVLAVWVGGPDRSVAWLAPAGELETRLAPLWTSHDLAVAASDPEGRGLFGTSLAGGVSLTPAETRLPFMLTVAPLHTRAPVPAMRRLVLAGGLSLAFLLMVAAGYGLYRATSRELALARQQADFVAAVSHEFRTPLTSMRHLTDLLATRGVTNDERRAHYYSLLAHETDRLHRLVEGLLSFGRIEAGAYAWRLEPVDVGTLVRAVVDEFRRDPSAASRELAVETDDGLPMIRADAEALSRALWNLLENAAKYSPADAPVRVFARRAGGAVHVGVGDRGFGIPPEEHDHIFRTFARGDDARRSSIRGVGIGLALVKRIVEAHGGSIEVASAPGQGSTFTLVIPCRES